MKYTIHLTDWKHHQAELMNIRTEVFMQEQQVSATDEWDGLDEQAIHFLVLSEAGEAVGCARLLTENPASPAFHIGRVALRKPLRNRGIGHQLMRYVLKYCQKTAPQNRIYLHAQTARITFYTQLGFVTEGDEFMDAGIAHISMVWNKQGDRAWPNNHR